MRYFSRTMAGVSLGNARKGMTACYHLRGEVCNTRLADLTARKPDFRSCEGSDRERDLLCGFSEEGMEEVCTAKGSGNDWRDPTTGGIDVD